MKIHIIWLGKTKDDYLKSGLGEYIKRIKPYADIEISEVKDESLKNTVADVKKQEGERVLKAMKVDYAYMSLDQYGKQYDSISFSKYIHDDIGRVGKIGFIIGGVYGLDESVREKTKLISFSKFTFTHQMIRVMLFEQIYRAITIEKNKKYHY